jgi:hypothetical protein
MRAAQRLDHLRYAVLRHFQGHDFHSLTTSRSLLGLYKIAIKHPKASRKKGASLAIARSDLSSKAEAPSQRQEFSSCFIFGPFSKPRKQLRGQTTPATGPSRRAVFRPVSILLRVRHHII